jgi:acetyl-CoA synthetase
MNIEKRLTSVNKSYKRKNIHNIDLEQLYNISDQKEFFKQLADKFLIWEKKYTKVLDESNAPHFIWFKGGKINPLENILTKHLSTEKKNKAALIWKGSDHVERIFTYQSLYSEVSKCAAALTKLGVKYRDKVQIYMPNIPELVITMLACLKIGAVHSVYHHSYSADAFSERIDDCKPFIVITSNTTILGSEKNMKEKVDEALNKSKHQPEYCIVVERTQKKVHMKPLRDIWYHDLISDSDYSDSRAITDTVYNSEDTIFLLITSTNLNVPKSLKFSVAGYLLWAFYSYCLFFDPKEDDTYWCTADISWITGHSYVIYGPLMAGQTTVMFEDSIDINNAGRFYDLVDKFNINKIYTTPSILKSLMNAAHKKNVFRKQNSIELVAAGGEKQNPIVVEWVFENILNEKGPFLDIFTLTEAGGAICGEIPGVSDFKMESVSKPLPGVSLSILDSNNNEISTPNEQGELLIASLPSICNTICNGDDIYRKIYWKKVNGKYLFKTGDGAEYTADMDIKLTGRLDNVLHIGGKRVSLIEIETALAKHPNIKEVAIVPISDEKRGDKLIAFCVVNNEIDESYYDKTISEFNEIIREEIANITCPSEYRFTKMLPKSPNGQILRDLLKEIAMQM